MQKLLKKVLILIALTPLLQSALPSGFAAAQGNLIQNGDFELGGAH